MMNDEWPGEDMSEEIMVLSFVILVSLRGFAASFPL
jgi:hypothetical protein